MPIYEYSCQDCGTAFERFVRNMLGIEHVECPHCHSKNCKKSISRLGMAGSASGSASAEACAPSG
jgi:putative FmdB family regulatory protein